LVHVRISLLSANYFCFVFLCSGTGRGATNGKIQVILSQVFLFAGLCFSAATIGDCALVVVEESIFVREDNATATVLGMFSYRDDESGSCYWWFDDSVSIEVVDEFSSGNETETEIVLIPGSDQITHYLTEVLGRDWYVAMIFCGVALGLSVLVFLYAVSFYCSTQVRACRSIIAVIVGIFLPVFQAVGTTLVFRSYWCDEEGCTVGRSTIFSIVAGFSFLGAGICFWAMDNWPGQNALEDMDKKRTWATDPYKEQRQSENRNNSTNGREESSSAAAAEPEISDTLVGSAPMDELETDFNPELKE
jgi:hypothetical protein